MMCLADETQISSAIFCAYNVFNTSLAAFRKCAFRTACRPWHVNGRGPRSGRDSAKRVSSTKYFLTAQPQNTWFGRRTDVRMNGRGPRSGRDSAQRVSSTKYFLTAKNILNK